MTVKFKGVTLPLAKMNRQGWAYANKEIEYPGVNDLELMNMGRRGRRVTVRGRLTGVTATVPTQVTLEALNDDTTGYLELHDVSMTAVVMEDLRWHAFYTDAVSGFLACEYEMQFRQLGE